MKKTLLALVVLPALAYPAAAWYLGTVVEAEMNRQVVEFSDTPGIRLLDRQYDRGVFHSSEVATVELFGSSTPPTTGGEMSDGSAAAEPVRLVYRVSTRHGPWIGDRFAAARQEMTVSFEPGAEGDLAKLFGGKALLGGRGFLSFDGSGGVELSSPPASGSWTPANGEPPVQVSWHGMNAHMRFSAGVQTYDASMEAPMLELSSGQGVHLVFRDMAFHADEARVFPDEATLYAGEQQLSIASITLSGADFGESDVELGGVRYEVEMPVGGEHFDVVTRLGAQTIRVGQSSYGPAHLDTTLKRLHARTALTLYKRLSAILANPDFGQDDASMAIAMDDLRAPAIQLLTHGPEIRVDRLSFNSPSGETRVELRAALPGITEQDLDNPFMLIGRLDAGARLTVPESILADLSRQAARRRFAALRPDAEFGPRQEALADKSFLDQLAMAQERGLVERAHDLLSARIEFSQGRLTVNDRPFDPAAFQE